LTFGFVDERNRTSTINNQRQTFSAIWSEQWRENLRTTLGFEHRHLDDKVGSRVTDSNMVVAAVEYKPTAKLELSVKREQNLSDADPTYPTQTTLAARYKLNDYTRIFASQRLASAPITPIGDVSMTGFGVSNSRRELAFGIETRLSHFGALNGRYQIEDGINGTDSFAVIGLQNRWRINKVLSLEAGVERGFLLAGADKSFNSGTFGAEWMPTTSFRASARYELRDRNGFGQLFAVGAAGKIGQNWTALARGQFAKTDFAGREGSSSNLMAAGAYRPLNSDRWALLFSYNHRYTFQQGSLVNAVRAADLREQIDSLSMDGLFAVSRDLELYGKFAMRFNGDGSPTNAYVSNLTYLIQSRIQQRLLDYFDIAAEGRWIVSPSSGTWRRSAGLEFGYWATPDIRLALGYNLNQSGWGGIGIPTDLRQFRSGFYFTLTTKLSKLFNLFGTSQDQLAANKKTTPNKTATRKKTSRKAGK
ncbi:MAG: hypothetical protein JO314_04480, partial [Acidobacteria bacterium]|nr:hypothetical protein [Acidobacteriota bacterium]